MPFITRIEKKEMYLLLLIFILINFIDSAPQWPGGSQGGLGGRPGGGGFPGKLYFWRIGEVAILKKGNLKVEAAGAAKEDQGPRYRVVKEDGEVHKGQAGLGQDKEDKEDGVGKEEDQAWVDGVDKEECQVQEEDQALVDGVDKEE
ncbi:hypothetical protein NECAME_11819 [Necator americanus]|uniref:Uncharacterized protein n=1 Tax=Necator americanus TaxID=51031 RepID=W2T5H8_NECAM|nr:hypothetical protein NECAME_11819 [Necator americanus]ETN76227.1 hypothetical protein NECAME_11819 [Necator americanus]